MAKFRTNQVVRASASPYAMFPATIRDIILINGSVGYQVEFATGYKTWRKEEELADGSEKGS